MHRRLNYNRETSVGFLARGAAFVIRHFIFRIRYALYEVEIQTELSNALGDFLSLPRAGKNVPPGFDPPMRREMTEGLKGREVTSKVGNKSCRRNRRKKGFKRRRRCIEEEETGRD